MWVRCMPEMEGECALAEYHNVHVEWFQVCRTVWVLVKRTETDKVVVTEQFNLLASLFHENIFRRQRVDAESACQYFHFLVSGTQHIKPPSIDLRVIIVGAADERYAGWQIGGRLLGFG